MPPDPARLRRWLLPLAVSATILLAACGGRGDDPVPPRASPGVVDSTLPIAEEIRRFVATVDSLPRALRHGAPDRESLVRAFVRAVERRDSLALPGLILQRDEFIALYYPSTSFTAPPYELSPSLVWFQMQNRSSRGITRLLQRDGGRPLGYLGTTCPDTGRVEGANRIWDRCTVRVRDSSGVMRERRLFGGMMEREGTWKFLTFANEY